MTNFPTSDGQARDGEPNSAAGEQPHCVAMAAEALIEKYLGPGVRGGDGTAWSLSSPDRCRLVYLHTSRNGQQTATIFDTGRRSHLGSRTICISGPADLHDLERELEHLISPPAV